MISYDASYVYVDREAQHDNTFYKKLSEKSRENIEKHIEKIREKAAEKQKEFQEKLEEKMSESKDGTIYLNDTAIRTIIEAAQEEDAGKTTVKEQARVGANLDLKI